jgi:hypothetical protein
MTDRTFEKLLDEKKVMWRRVADEAAKGPRDAAAVDKPLSVEGYALKDAKDATLRATYIVDAPAEHLNEILGELEKIAKRVDAAVLKRDDAAAEPQRGQQRFGSRARRHLESILDRAPRSVVITLFCPAEPTPAAPAEKAP